MYNEKFLSFQSPAPTPNSEITFLVSGIFWQVFSFFLSFFFFFKDFWCGPFKNFLLYLLQCCFCFYVLVFWPQDMWDLGSLTKNNLHPLHWKRTLTTEPPGMSCQMFSMCILSNVTWYHHDPTGDTLALPTLALPGRLWSLVCCPAAHALLSAPYRALLSWACQPAGGCPGKSQGT